MEYSEFTGSRRPLTWVRTPLYDHEYELTRQSNSDTDLPAAAFRQQAKRRNTLPNSPIAAYIRNFTWRILRSHKNQLPQHQPNGIPGIGKRASVKKRPVKRWNMMHFVVGGQQFQCPEWIFEGHPETVLGDAEKRALFYHVKRKCFIFPQALPDVFTSVLEYYQTGLLTRPERLTLNYFLEQLEIFELEPLAIDVLLRSQGVHKMDCASPPPSDAKPTVASRVWDIMEHPHSSFLARTYCNFSLFLTVLSVVLYVIETLPELKEYSLVGCRSISEAFKSPLTVVNFLCFLFFFLEFSTRLACCPSKKVFFHTWTNWTDLLSIIPYTLVVLLLAIHFDDRRTMPLSVLNTLRACRLFLVTRILGTSRYYRQHWIVILVQTLWNNLATLFVLFFLMIICMVGFGGIIYALEGVGQEHPTFPTIPYGMWWAVVTMTTVGYGDVVPKHALGQITAIVCGCVGLMFIGFVLESVTYEYHRLMKTNSQYLRYQSEVEFRKAPPPIIEKPAIKRITSCRVSMLNLTSENEVVVSINGAEFLFNLADLNFHPNSLLGHPSKRAQFFNPTTGSYFFPRNQDIFFSIHNYFRNPESVLRRPPFISMQRFVEEIEFFQLRPQAVIDFFASEGIRLVDEKEPKNARLRYWHLVLEHHQFNLLAKIISLLSMLATACFTVMVILESLPSVLDPSCSTALSATFRNHSFFANRTVSFYESMSSDLCFPELTFFIVETICTGYFVLEFSARFFVCPSKRDFLKRAMNWVDLLVISPYVFTLIQLTCVAPPSEHLSVFFGFFRTMRLLRLISILKFARYFKRLQMIFAILQSTWAELLMLCYFMLINSVIFGTLVFVVEAHVEGVFNSIPRGMYWAWVTMLTIGYGDLIPETPQGKVVGAGCAILGIVFWTLPMTLISDHFANYRRLYEGQEYLMKCLTRMNHLLDSETKRGNVKMASTMTETDLLQVVNEGTTGGDRGDKGDRGDRRDSRDISPRGPLLPKKHRSKNTSSRHTRNTNNRSVSPHVSQNLENDTISISQCRFSRLEYDNNVGNISAAKHKGSSVTLAHAGSVIDFGV